MDDLTLIFCHPSAGFHQTVETGTVRHVRKELHAVSAAELNKHAEAASTKWLAFSRAPGIPIPEELEQTRKRFQSHPHLKMLLYFSRSQKEALGAWQELPPRIAALRQNWAELIETVVFPTSFAKTQGFADVSDPLWDFMIRISFSPESIQVRQATEEIGEVQTQPLKLPALAPDVPGSTRQWLKSHLEAGSPEELVPKASSRADANALRAGLLQIHDYLEESHELSQSIEGEGRHSAGDYWHAIMHRREPDYGNSKYWFRHVGQHPIFEPLRNAVDQMLKESGNSASHHARKKLLSKGHWDPLAFVDFCQECAKGNDPEWTRIAEEIQWREMRLLLEQTCRDAMA